MQISFICANFVAKVHLKRRDMKLFVRLLTLSCFLCMSLFLWACSSGHAKKAGGTGNTNTKENVDVDKFETLIADKDKVFLLDVRTPDEFEEEHIDGAIAIDFKERSFRDECLKQLPKDKVIAVYCRSGFRSSTASNILLEEGFNVVNLKGGITAWKEAGKPTVKQ